MKRLTYFIAGSLLAGGLGGCGGSGGGTTASAPVPPTSGIETSTSPTTTGMRALTSLQLSAQMSPGLNLGNTLEAIPAETSWGNPVPTQALMNAYKAAGFKTVRIPVAWSQYADASNTISPTWMAHIKQVVDYAHNAGLYAMINIHWDGGWITATADKQAAVNAKLTTFWTQIATTFKGYDDYLLFAGTNEIGVEGVYGAPTATNCAVQNSYNQTFVNAVRATGGNNAVRHLVVQGYVTNIDYAATCNAKLPNDTVASRLMMEVHYYDPYDFTLNSNSNIWQWGKIATDASATETWADESWADAEFQKMKTTFIDKGVPVILGEYGAGMKAAYPGMDTYRKYWDQYITQSAFQHGLVPVYWDTGGMFNRSTGAPQDTEVIAAIVAATK